MIILRQKNYSGNLNLHTFSNEKGGIKQGLLNTTNVGTEKIKVTTQPGLGGKPVYNSKANTKNNNIPTSIRTNFNNNAGNKYMNAGIKAGQFVQNHKEALLAGAAVIGAGAIALRNRRKRKEAEEELELERARNRR